MKKSTASIDEVQDAVPFMKKVIDVEAQAVKFIFGNGTKVTCAVKDVSEPNKLRLMLHGISQKCGDAASGFSKTLNYAGAFEAVGAVAENLSTPDWNMKGDGFGGVADLIQAVANIKGRKVEEVAKVYDSISPEERKTWNTPETRAEVLTIRTARAKAAVPADSEPTIAGLD